MKQRHPASASHRAVCHVCKRGGSQRDMVPWHSVRPRLSELIARDHPGWAEGCFICRADLGVYRRRYVETLLEADRGALGDLERQVLDSLQSGQTISQMPDERDEARASVGARMADRVASFGGSWPFILSFLGVLVLWMALNVGGWLFRPFDPFPFILLNLVLSCVAALQAPVIMMSQRRQDEKDRLRAENDYRVNLKSEIEIRQLHEKIDHHWERLAEMAQMQIEMLEERGDGRSG